MSDKIIIDTKPIKINKFHQEYIKKFKNNKFPLFSNFEFNLHGSCNRRCAFCPRVDEKIWPNLDVQLEDDLFKSVIDQLKELDYTGRISFSGFSEPFLHTSLLDYIKQITKKLPNAKSEIITNGDYLNSENLLGLFNNGLKYLYVSLYTSKKTYDKFLNLKTENNLSDDQFEIRPRNLGRKMNFGLNINNRAGSVDYTRFGLKQKSTFPLKKQCNYPMYTIFMDYNGDCLICPDDWKKKKIIGNSKKMKIYDIWIDQKFHEVRKRLLNFDRNDDPCNECDVNGRINGDEFAEKWKNYYF